MVVKIGPNLLMSRHQLVAPSNAEIKHPMEATCKRPLQRTTEHQNADSSTPINGSLCEYCLYAIVQDSSQRLVDQLFAVLFVLSKCDNRWAAKLNENHHQSFQHHDRNASATAIQSRIPKLRSHCIANEKRVFIHGVISRQSNACVKIS